MASEPRKLIDPDAMLDELAAQQRAPFQRELALWLANAPTEADIKAFAAKSPDRWAQGVAILTRAAGYSDRHEVTGDGGLLGFVKRARQLSDSELDQQLAAFRTAPALSDDNGTRQK